MRQTLSIASFILIAAFCAGPLLKWQPFYTYFYFFAWAPFLWVVYAWLKKKEPDDELLRKDQLLLLFPFSITLWLLFEALNFRLNNWIYFGIPDELWIRWPGYALSFSTVAPAILGLGTALEKTIRSKDENPTSRSVTPRRRRMYTLLGIGTLMLLLALLFPRQFFPLVWGGIFFLAEPAAQAMERPSLLLQWKERRFKTTQALLLSGLLCGLYWEMCNFWAGAKWMYDIPYVGFLKIFEMPVLGFIGFPAFALEVYALYQAFVGYWIKIQNKSARWKSVVVLGMLFFWIATFYGIDRWTVATWR